MKAVAVLLTLLLVSATADASITVTDYHNFRREGSAWDLIKMFLNGVGQGMQLLQVMAPEAQKNSHICQPDNLALNADNYVRVVDDQIAYAESQKIDVKAIPIEIMLYYGMQRTFPCK